MSTIDDIRGLKVKVLPTVHIHLQATFMCSSRRQKSRTRLSFTVETREYFNSAELKVFRSKVAKCGRNSKKLLQRIAGDETIITS